MKEFNYELIKASTNDFALDRLIGKGSHGSVYKGVLKVDHKHQVQVVAVKNPSPSLSQSSEPSKLDNEIKILSSIQSPHIVNLIGISHGTGHDNKLLITEFMPNGSLHDLLHSPRTNPLPLPTWHHRMFIALQVAHAIHVLHLSDPPVIHRDIKSANILLDRCWNARLADFSLAVTWRQRTHHHNDDVLPAGTFGYLDPGYTDASRLGPANDVYSFGVVLMELVSGRKVMDVERDPTSIVEWVGPRVRRGKVGEVLDERVGLLRSSGRMEGDVKRVLGVAVGCVEKEEERRPTMGEVVRELRWVVEGMVWRARSSCSTNWGWRVYRRCVRAWKRCKKKRVRNTTTTKMTTKIIVCKDHLIEDDDDDDDDDDNEDKKGGG